MINKIFFTHLPRSPMPLKFDATLKDLVQAYAADWLAVLDEPPSGPVEVFTPDLSTLTAFSDIVLRIGDWLLHLDFQSGPDPTCPDASCCIPVFPGDAHERKKRVIFLPDLPLPLVFLLLSGYSSLRQFLRRLRVVKLKAGPAEAVVEKSQADFTSMFRDLSAEGPVTGDRYQAPDFQAWYARWQQRLDRDGQGRAAALAVMRDSNPAVIPRNQRVEEALAAPYEERPELAKYREATPDACTYRTFCGT